MMTTDRSVRPKTRDRHVARSARILSTGLSATAILGITAAFGAADRAQSAAPEETPTTSSGIASVPSALAPLGAAAPTTQTAPVSQLRSPEGTITLPTGSPTPVQAASANASPVETAPVVTAPAATTPAATTPAETTPATTPAETTPATAAPAPTVTVAPIAPAEPVVELTIPPAPSNGSSGGSR